MVMSRAAHVVGLLLAASPACAASIEVAVVDGAGKPVAEVAVWALVPGSPSEARGVRAQIEQLDREFLPYLTVIQQGTTVTFPNRDPILHHVYSFSPAKPFEIKLYTGRSPSEIVFDKAGVVTLGCNIHDWMIGLRAGGAHAPFRADGRRGHRAPARPACGCLRGARLASAAGCGGRAPEPRARRHGRGTRGSSWST